jgi:hypothetical protein
MAINKIRIPAKMSAMAAGTSLELVKKARAGQRISGSKAKKVLQADQLLEVGMNKLIAEVKRVLSE